MTKTYNLRSKIVLGVVVHTFIPSALGKVRLLSGSSRSARAVFKKEMKRRKKKKDKPFIVPLKSL